MNLAIEPRHWIMMAGTILAAGLILQDVIFKQVSLGALERSRKLIVKIMYSFGADDRDEPL